MNHSIPFKIKTEVEQLVKQENTYNISSENENTKVFNNASFSNSANAAAPAIKSKHNRRAQNRRLKKSNNRGRENERPRKARKRKRPAKSNTVQPANKRFKSNNLFAGKNTHPNSMKSSQPQHVKTSWAELPQNSSPNAVTRNIQAGKIEVKKETFKKSQEKRINKSIKKGMDPERAKEKERTRIAAKKRAKAAKKKRQAAKKGFIEACGKKQCRSSNAFTETNQAPELKKQSTWNSSQTDVNKNCKVAIAHKNYPKTHLTSEQMEQMKIILLNEIDKLPKHSNTYGFISSVNRDGWLSLTCCNDETKKWLIECIPKLQPFLNVELELFEGNYTPQMYVCTTYLLPSAVLPPNILLTRLEKQNGGLCTASWKILRIDKDPNGGESITFSVDEESKNRIVSQFGELFLNFTKIHVNVKGEPITSHEEAEYAL